MGPHSGSQNLTRRVITRAVVFVPGVAFVGRDGFPVPLLTIWSGWHITMLRYTTSGRAESIRETTCHLLVTVIWSVCVRFLLPRFCYRF